MANALAAPQILVATVGTGVSTLTPSSKAGTILVKLLARSPASVWITWDGTAPAAAFGNGVWEMEPGDGIWLNAEEVPSVKAIAVNAADGFLQVAFYPQGSTIRGVS